MTDGTRFFVADFTNNRVLIWNTVPTSDDAPANVVVGQTDMTSNGSGCTSSTLNQPWSVASDGTHLIVSDYSNSRVLVWNSIPTTNGVAANAVLGESSFTGCGGGHSSTLISGQVGVSTDGTRILVSDYNNHRVLIWRSFPTVSTGAAASVVLGQSNFTAHTSPSPSSNTMMYPGSAVSDGTHVIVQDSGNNRILIWNSIPTTSGLAANIVLGQPDFTTTSYGTSATNMSTSTACSATYASPGYVDLHGGKIYMADSCNSRVMIWNSIPTAFTSGTAIPANIVLGQPNFTSNATGSTAQSLNTPSEAFSNGTSIYVTDWGNNRIVLFPDPTH